MKNIKALLGSLAIAAILGANGYMAMSGTKAQSELTLEGVERVAQGFEWSSYLPGKNWYSYNYKVRCERTEEGHSGQKGSSYPPYYNYTSSIVKVFDVTVCLTGDGNCWWSDDTDCRDLLD